jgi:uncharacterized membrane protein YcaP (DUF421 family)
MASIFIRTIIIYILVSISLKAMGKRQLGELEISELVSTLLISEIASLPIADPDIPLMNAIIPLIFIVCLEIIISTVKNKSEKLKRYVEGEPTFVIYQGVLRQDALKQHRISINELLCEIRMQGVADIKDVYYAILEQNGKLSVFEKKDCAGFSHTVIIDKEINEMRIKALGYNDTWVKKQLERHKVKQSDVFLMTVDDSGNTYIIKNDEKNESV